MVEHPQPGEIVFVEGSTVLTRRWTWRQAKHTLVVPESRWVEINVDGLPPVTQAQVEDIGRQLSGLVQQYCGGQIDWKIISAANPTIQL